MTAKSLSDLKQRERDERRGLIRNTARDLFAAKDFRQVSGREIARSAGMSIGTLYNYYENLDALFLDIFLAHASELIGRIDADCGNPPALKQLCEVYIIYLNDHLSFYQMMSHFMLGSDFSAQATENLNARMRLLMDRFESAVRSAGIERDARLVAHALFSSLNGIMISYANYPGATPQAIRRHALRLAGVVARAFLSLAPAVKTTAP